MKKILFAALAVVAISFASCNGGASSTDTTDSTSVDTIAVDSVEVVVDSTVVE